MADTVDLTIEILKQIRDAVLQTNARLDQTREELGARLDQTNARLDQTNARLDQTREELSGRLADVAREQMRQGTAIIELHQGMTKVAEAMAALGHRQETLEHGVEQLVGELHTLNGRLDNVLIGPMGRQVRDHEDRIVALERRVG